MSRAPSPIQSSHIFFASLAIGGSRKVQQEESRGETWTSKKCTCGQQMMIYDAPRKRPKRSLSLSLVETWPVSTLPAYKI